LYKIQVGSGTHPAFIQWLWGGYFLRCLILSLTAHFCVYTSVEFRNMWSYTSTPAMANWRPADRIRPAAWFTTAPAKSQVWFDWWKFQYLLNIIGAT
jgi:hypothetical protein